MPHGSFLKSPVHSAADLLRQVRQDPLVSKRYVRLFHMSPDMVRAAFAQLHITRMNSDSIRKIYYVHPGEQIGYHVRRLNKAISVFANPDGTPMLVVACGNPVRSAEYIAQFAVPSIPDFSEQEEQPVISLRTQAFQYLLRNETPGEALTHDPAEPAASDFIVANDAVPADQPLPTFDKSLSPTQLRSVSSNQLLEWAGGAGLLGPLLMLNGSRSEAPPVPIFTNNSNTPPPPPDNNGGNNGGDIGGNSNGNQEMVVPESNGQFFLAAVVAGSLVFLGLKKRLTGP